MKSSSKDFFQSINEFPHSIGIYLTYTLDTEVIDKLTEFSTGTKLILHDYKHGKSIDDNDNSSIICLPIKTLNPNDKNCFHSKLVLLKSETGAKLIIGSANLSTNSFSFNEPNIAMEVELSFKEETDVSIYNQVLKFLKQLTGEDDKEKRQILIPKNILERTIEYLKHPGLVEKEGEMEFVFNSEGKSIFSELKNYLTKNRRGQKTTGIKIATPFVSDNYHKIKELKEISNNISIFLRKGAKINPFKEHQFKIFQPAHKKREKFHAKLILIEYNSDAVLFIGSANFTEQGFFKTLNESANQECGIIIRVSKEEMNEWFNEKLWKLLSENEIENYKESEDGYLEDFNAEEKYYAWAENDNSKIATYIFNPNKLPVTKTKDGKKVNLLKINEDSLFFTNELEEQNQKVIFYIDGEKVSISIFEMSEYISGLNEKGESIFDSFKGMYSVNPSEMDSGIDKEKLSVSETTSIKITEPPKLEQYFYNVKTLLRSIENKKYFTAINEKEIQNEINKTDDGRTLYLSLQLLKALKTNNTKQNLENIIQVCRDRILELSNKLGIDTKNLNTFIKRWLTSKI